MCNLLGRFFSDMCNRIELCSQMYMSSVLLFQRVAHMPCRRQRQGGLGEWNFRAFFSLFSRSLCWSYPLTITVIASPLCSYWFLRQFSWGFVKFYCWLFHLLGCRSLSCGVDVGSSCGRILARTLLVSLQRRPPRGRRWAPSEPAACPIQGGLPLVSYPISLQARRGWRPIRPPPLASTPSGWLEDRILRRGVAEGRRWRPPRRRGNLYIWRTWWVSVARQRVATYQAKKKQILLLSQIYILNIKLLVAFVIYFSPQRNM